MSNPENPTNYAAVIIKRLEKQLEAAQLKVSSILEHIEILRSARKP